MRKTIALIFILLLTKTGYCQVITVLSQTNVPCTKDTTGGATFSITGASFPYSAIITGCTSKTITGINSSTFSVNNISNCLPYGNIAPDGQYSVTLKDNSNTIVGGCTFTINSINPFMLLQENAYSNISCYNANDGYSNWVCVYGTSPFNYLWSSPTNSNVSNTNTLTNASPGFYTITATDANNCKLKWGDSFSNPPPLLLSYTISAPTQPLCCNGVITYSASGGEAGLFQYSFSINPAITSTNSICSGDYTLTVSRNVTCIATETLSINCLTGIKEYNTFKEFTIYPNPASDVLNIKAEIEVDLSMTFIDVYGREIKKFDNANGKVNKIDIKDFRKGIYFLHLYNNNKLIGTKKIMKE